MGENIDAERADIYELFSQFFLGPPDEETVGVIRQDFSLDSKDAADEISRDFDELFSYPHGRLVPLESLFSPTKGIGQPDVADIYAGAGLVVDDMYDVAPDHISLEFLFMSYLIERGRTAMEQKFLEQHLVNWVPYYCDKIMKQAQTGYYREIAEIIKDFLLAEYDAYRP